MIILWKSLKGPVMMMVIMISWQILIVMSSPLVQNYTSDLLRRAKAAEIKAYLDIEREPCHNFHMYACGRWKRSHPVNQNLTSTSYLDQLQDLYARKSADMLFGERKSTTLMDAKLSDLFLSCRHKDDPQHLRIEPILRVVNFLGGWPIVSSKSWYEYEFDWLRIIADLRRKLGINILIGLDVIPHLEDRDMHRIRIGAPDFKLTRDEYLKEDYAKKRDEYKEHITGVLRRFFPEMPMDWATEVASQVLSLEQELVRGLPEKAQNSLAPNVILRYVSELRTAYGNYVDLNRYLSLIFNDTIYQQVYEAPVDYMSNLVEVIKHTPKHTIANYTMWRVVDKFAAELSTDNKLHNSKACVEKIRNFFPLQLESMFQRNHNSILLINELQEVWADIKQAFRDELQTSNKLNWLALETRQKCIHKLDSMDLEILTHDDDSLLLQTQHLVIRKDSYFQNLINILQWQTQQNLAKLVDKPRAPQPKVQLPKYEVTKNKVLIPVTLLQARIFWDASYPNALKYSSIGFLLAKELVHGFDEVGRRYDRHGYQNGWWDLNSKEGFSERSKCFAHQVDKLTFGGNKVEDPDALSKTISDNGGLNIAYRAYQKWWSNVESREAFTHENLPILSYTQNQLFFIGFAQLWCAEYDEHFGIPKELTEQLRVNGAVSNNNDFARDFECRMGSKMNPEHQCTIY